VHFATFNPETLVGCTQQQQQYCRQHLNTLLGDMKGTMSPTVAVVFVLLLLGADAARRPDLLGMLRGTSVSPTKATGIGSPTPPNFPDSYEVNVNRQRMLSKSVVAGLCKLWEAALAMCP
jgi:hypothetical protein